MRVSSGSVEGMGLCMSDFGVGGFSAVDVPGDVVRIEGVRACGTHGVLDSEHVSPQPFVVDVAMLVDVSFSAARDDLSATVNYAEVAQQVTDVITGEHVDLVETLAVRIADVVLGHEVVEQVEVKVHKPHAPVGLPFSDVSVTVSRSDVRTAVVALGANLGSAGRTLALAVEALRGLPRTSVRAVSSVVETDPVGGPQQPVYVNAVAVLRTTLRPRTLLRALHEIEAEHGRVREVHWGARTLDLDLVQYGRPECEVGDVDVVVDEPDLVLPHPRAHERGFVLAPWVSADPGACLRVGSQVRLVRELLADMGLDEVGLPEGVRPGPEWVVLP